MPDKTTNATRPQTNPSKDHTADNLSDTPLNHTPPTSNAEMGYLRTQASIAIKLTLFLIPAILWTLWRSYGSVSGKHGTYPPALLRAIAYLLETFLSSLAAIYIFFVTRARYQCIRFLSLENPILYKKVLRILIADMIIAVAIIAIVIITIALIYLAD